MTATEQLEREEHERALKIARAAGFLEAIGFALQECEAYCNDEFEIVEFKRKLIQEALDDTKRSTD